MVEDVAEFLLVAWAPCHFVHLGTGLIVRVGAADVVEEFLELGGEVLIGRNADRMDSAWWPPTSTPRRR